MAAGIAATFNAPMGGAIFSMEVISKKFTSLDAVPILLAAVVGKAVASELINPVSEFVTSCDASFEGTRMEGLTINL